MPHAVDWRDMNPITSPIRLNGLRLSNRLIYIRQSLAGRVSDTNAPLYRLFAEKKINIEFLNFSYSGNIPYIGYCISPDADRQLNRMLLAGKTGTDIVSNRNMGLFSIYPHRYNLHVLGGVLEIIGRKRLRFYEMASSGSMLTFVVDFNEQEKIVQSILREIELPETHTPFRQIADTDDICMAKTPETSATYCEERIRTYGILAKPGPVMYRIKTDWAGLSSNGKKIASLDDLGIGFNFVSAVVDPKERIWITILCDKVHASMQGPVHDREDKEDIGQVLWVSEKLALISLQGPHFGDRHGIADRAFSALVENGINIISGACVGASIFIAIDAMLAEKAKTILRRFFDDPFKIRPSAPKNRQN